MRTPGGNFHKSRDTGKAVGTGKVGWEVTNQHLWLQPGAQGSWAGGRRLQLAVEGVE